jgi:hypothetical protein
MAEYYTDSEGTRCKFYNGPSPDEVALVEYAASMEFDCLKSNDDVIQAKLPSFANGIRAN